MWDVTLLVDSYFSTEEYLWADIKTDDLMDEAKRLQNLLKKQPRKTYAWSVYKSLRPM